jgi:hypothetical protein
MSGQPTIQGREKMRASKRQVAKEDLKSNLVGDRERDEGGDPGTETLVQDTVTHASRILRSKAGGTQPTSRRVRGRGRGMAQVNLCDSRSTPITSTGEGTSEDSGADIGASVDGILQILVRCRFSAMVCWAKILVGITLIYSLYYLLLVLP